MQTIFDLHETVESALKLTTALYYTPSGRSIHKEYSGQANQANRIQVGDHELPAALVMDVILEAEMKRPPYHRSKPVLILTLARPKPC